MASVKEKQVCLREKQKLETKHRCTDCDKDLECPSIENLDNKCTCTEVLLCCACPKCMDLSSDIKGIVGFVCETCEIRTGESDDEDDDFLFLNL